MSTANPSRAERREQLLDAADRAIRAEGPTVSMEAIADEAGITKPILYRHFGDKGGLYEALARRYVEEVGAAIDAGLSATEDPRERLRVTIDAFLALIEDEPQTYRFLMHRAVAERAEARQALDDFTHQLAGRIAVVLREEFEAAGLAGALAEPVAHGLIGMVQHAGEWWLAGAELSREDLVSSLVSFAWRGLAGLPPAERWP